MNILVHALDGVLLWIVLRRLSVPGAWLGALLFVIHPVHAESVAWVAERKNTLSLCFCLWSLMAWLRFEDSKKWTKYTWALLLFLAALLCKTHVVVFPAVLMLLSWWRTGSIPVITPAIEIFRSMGKGEKPVWQLFNYDLARFVPFFVLTGALSLVTVWFQNDRAIGSEVIPIGDFNSRLAGASVVVWCYLSKALLPISLNTIYANTAYLWWPLTNPKFWMFLAGALVPMTLLCTLFMNQIYPTGKPRVDRTPFFVFAFFVGTLFPVLGFFTMSYMRLTLQADHFQYFSDISIVAAVGAIIAILYSKANDVWRPVMVSACVVLVFSCCAYTWERAGVHWSEKTLWEACLKKNEASWQAHNHIGAVYYSEQRFSEAAPHFARAVELKPANPEVHNNLGLVLELAGHRTEAIKEFEKAVEIKGEVVALRGNLARAYVQSGRFTDAVDQFKAMLKEVPLDPNVHTMLGSVYAQLNRLPEAKQEFEEALRIDPNNPQAKQNCELLRRMGK